MPDPIERFNSNWGSTGEPHYRSADWQGELKLAMGNFRTETVADITRAYVATPDWKI